MATPVRASARIRSRQYQKREKEKQIRKWRTPGEFLSSSEQDTEEEEGQEEEEELASLGVEKTPRSNNFIKVHNRYNADIGCGALDYYEGDFIDDNVKTTSNRRKRRRTKRKGVRKESEGERTPRRNRLLLQSSSESEGVTEVTVGGCGHRVLSIESEEEEEREGGGGEKEHDTHIQQQDLDDEEVVGQQLGKKRKKRRLSRRALEEEEEEEEGEEEEDEEGRKRSGQGKKSKPLESDEDIQMIATPNTRRKPSSRAQRLKGSKEKTRSNRLRRLLLAREGESAGDSSSDSDHQGRTGTGSAWRGGDGGRGGRRVWGEDVNGEKLLFPESDGESTSDWIVSDFEEYLPKPGHAGEGEGEGEEREKEEGEEEEREEEEEELEEEVDRMGEDTVMRQVVHSSEDWMSRLTTHRIFHRSLTSTQPQKLLKSLLSSSHQDQPDRHGLVPLVYAAGLANEEALKQLLPLTDLSSVQEVLHSHHTTLLHVVVQAPLWHWGRCGEDWGRSGEGLLSSDADSHCCLKALYHFDRDYFEELLCTHYAYCPTPLAVAVWYQKPMCVQFLLWVVVPPITCYRPEDDSSDLSDESVSMGTLSPLPSLLHLAVMDGDREMWRGKRMEGRGGGRGEGEGGRGEGRVGGGEGEREGGGGGGGDGEVAQVLVELLQTLQWQLEDTDHLGYTPLMHACNMGDLSAVKVLLDYGASIACRDSQGTSPLHLAALSGWVECVRELISRGHPVDCRDKKGWTPLLYAHFQDHHDCVLELMQAKPQQLSILSSLLRRDGNDEGWMKTVKVVRSLLVSLAHHEVYYAVFNKFVRENPSILEEKEYGFLKHCMGLLDYQNKLTWIRNKFKILRNHADVRYSRPLSLISLPRSPAHGLLAYVRDKLVPVSPTSCWLQPLTVTFQGEPGICTGPRKEFWSLYCQELSTGKGHIFVQCENGQLRLQPGLIFQEHSAVSCTKLDPTSHRKDRQLVGMMLAQAVFHGDNLALRLAPSLLKQLLGVDLSHPGDLEQVDESLFHNILQCENISDLDLTFSDGLLCPWSGEFIEVPLVEGGCDVTVSNDRKLEYMQLISHFKLEQSVTEETKSFCAGFWQVIPKKCLQVFNANELSLFLSGVPTISVEDWRRNTAYSKEVSSDTIRWFWRLVRSLKEEERALLLKFATGSPCVPSGGFQALQGYSGLTKFNIASMPGMNKIPQAATCFNTLKLSSYSSEQELRDKIFIAIRYGCEGFGFS